MLRFILLSILITILARAFWRLMDGVIDGMRSGGSIDSRQAGGQRSAASARAVAMQRDPVCGTFVVPDRAVTLDDANGTVYFCSTGCRDAYQPKPRSRFRPGAIRDRTA